MRLLRPPAALTSAAVRNPVPTPVRALVPAAALALVLTGCTGDGPELTVGGTPSPTASATTAPTTAPTSPDASPSPVVVGTEQPVDPLSPRPAIETPPPLGAPACRAADLTLTDADAVVTPQVVQEIYVLRTTGRDCQLQGFPEVSLLDAGGRAMPVRYSRGGFGLDVDEDGPVTLSRSTSVSFRVASGRDGSCAAVATIVATLPGTGGPLRAPTFLQVCQGTAGIAPVGRLADDHGNSG